MSIILIALSMIFIGVMIIIEKFSFFELSSVLLQWWPVIIIVFGLEKLKRRTYKEAGIIVIFGFLFLLSTLSVIPIKWHSLLLPGILILIGFKLLFNRSVFSKHSSISDSLNNLSIFSGFSSKVNSSDFRGGTVTAIFGSAEIDLSQACSTIEEISMDLNTVFGGIEIKVPHDWIVNVSGLPILAGIENTCNKSNSGSKKLNINAFAMFGGIEIKN